MINYFFHSDNEGPSPDTNQTSASKGPDSDVSWYEKAFAVANNSTSGNKSKFQQLYCNIELKSQHKHSRQYFLKYQFQLWTQIMTTGVKSAPKI